MISPQIDRFKLQMSRQLILKLWHPFSEGYTKGKLNRGQLNLEQKKH